MFFDLDWCFYTCSLIWIGACANVTGLAFPAVSDLPLDLRPTGMNLFLKNLDITFRRDPTNYRPRINKGQSTKDREQKEAGTYYYMDE